MGCEAHVVQLCIADLCCWSALECCCFRRECALQPRSLNIGSSFPLSCQAAHHDVFLWFVFD
jgi:hypothetical protein